MTHGRGGGVKPHASSLYHLLPILCRKLRHQGGRGSKNCQNWRHAIYGRSLTYWYIKQVDGNSLLQAVINTIYTHIIHNILLYHTSQYKIYPQTMKSVFNISGLVYDRSLTIVSYRVVQKNIERIFSP